MFPITLIISTACATLAIFFLGFFVHRWWIANRTKEEKRGDKRCTVCQVKLVEPAVRSLITAGVWDYRCQKHKGVA